MTLSQGIAVGRSKGFTVTKVEKTVRPSNRKGVEGKRTKFVKKLVQEVTGFAPYERRVMELLKVGRDKRALKVLKNRLGGHSRAKRKREILGEVLREQAAAARKK
eukprot:TRINITY_DN5485_c0_g4_i1.p1 TRINITY_DN5485_c0_g4~~TRINITY_DN5485_c0_g4_i1.p1  ORF type:complete len:105 (+),score=36.29 TRINITY_DN5485_c0_g4_i1:400-714(+)